jgi:hypothetical protein
VALLGRIHSIQQFTHLGEKIGGTSTIGQTILEIKKIKKRYLAYFLNITGTAMYKNNGPTFFPLQLRQLAAKTRD